MQEDILTKLNHRYIYTYDYAPDSVWEAWRDEVYGEGFSKSGKVPAWTDEEADEVIKRIRPGLPSWILLADSHFVYNGTWEDTVSSLKAVSERMKLEGVIHLGDLSDGLLSAKDTADITKKVISDMKGISKKIFVVPGNHDYNYFRSNPDTVYPDIPQFFVDEEEQKLRMIFIDSFDPAEQVRYGFSDYCIHWLESTLRMLPTGYSAVIFSHLTPLVRLQAWTDNIRNREKLIAVLDKYADNILAFINGHNHCDHIFNDLKNGRFPVISVNCAKCEYFTEHKPEGAEVPFRRLGCAIQESFDIMQVDTGKREIYFTRFGAGRDRIVRNGKGYFLG